ncbi:TlpA family protein disulfide reductase [Winogradskyella echinorum]|uniref:TlpA family protein disulfide reductase n=1 Tax=Winogradskyella echinorum TaxID=538189 RepID=A0ABR6XWM7_9FLAO|nr:TlpA disulfide reductase family protein [Winogradskyella echinorum]MBC3844900.1 TlpA family protein disulfide reductase [Winogradskyella echinorum]MBC5749248.1 TlpA family protein disulfide reductase [Winogradskyella echinorum]
MNSFKIKRFSLIIICVLTASYSYSQIKVSEFIQYSKTASTNNNKLIFIDFWATWCGPCITAKEHLGVLQKQFPSDFYVVSLTQENPLTVERFLKKKPTDLAIAIDYYGETFKKYGVRALPEGILLNAEGKVLWQGGAPDLKKEIVSKFLRKQTTKTSLESFFNVVAVDEVVNSEYIPKEAMEIKPIATNNKDIEVVDNDKYLRINGSLKQIIGYLARIYKNQIVLEKGLDTNYEVYFKKPFNSNDNLAYKLITEMNLNVERKYSKGEGIKLVVESPKFWDTNQIDWGKNNSKYLIGDSQIKADNVSLKDMAYQLAYVLDMPVIIPDDNELSLSLHDWDFHYKFFQLMQTDLEDNFGIKADKKEVTFPVYHIQKKAP